ncbi:sugar ABC transporter substrate-binding protein [Vallitalea longa]|uniref:Sugar ABC transporter substrate-binding protein n=1 Tax=Vallitalea longa TaxID=2936439 RepID=A0A9W6DFY5_9FIRM|nr:extracellular solute-binding protein [Vallitalea longa]GKX29972.1 sugar ABC transporter substrate-binding protein [Vallitalea longa]
MKKILSLTLVVLLLMMTSLVACKNDSESEKTIKNNESDNNQATSSEKTNKDELKGEIIVLTNRTNLVDTDFPRYAKKFNETYPKVKVSFEGMADYEGQVKIRMNTEDYGDVLLIPNISVTEMPDFFEPLGSYEELSEKYVFVEKATCNDVVYGIPTVAGVDGVLYNKKVFQNAGIEKLPSTPDEFIMALKKIKENTEAIPLYTNYASGWALSQWQGNVLSVSGDSDFSNHLLDNDTPFAEGEPMHILYKLMYDVAKEGLIEDDPMTTDFELSKQMIANGEIGVIVAGSWIIPQAQEFAENPDDIGFMPFPYTNKDGNVYSGSGGDYCIAVNKNSKNKEAAEAFLYFFLNESGFANDQNAIPPVKGADMPSSLEPYQEMGVKLISDNPAPEGKEGLVNEIQNESEIGFYNDDYKKRIIEAGIGNTDETFEDIVNDLNERWATARKNVVK